MKMLSILILTAAFAFAGEATPLPPAVAAVDTALQTAVDKATLAYLKALEAEVKKAQASLDREKANATKAGNLELALAIKAKQDALTVDSLVAKLTSMKSEDLLGGADKPKIDLAKIFIGRWHREADGAIYEIQRGGNGVHAGKIAMKWVVNGDKIVVSYPGNPSWGETGTIENNKFIGTASNGAKTVWIKDEK